MQNDQVLLPNTLNKEKHVYHLGFLKKNMKCYDLVKRINYFLKAYNNFYSNLRLYAHVTLYIENNSFWNLSCY